MLRSCVYQSSHQNRKSVFVKDLCGILRCLQPQQQEKQIKLMKAAVIKNQAAPLSDEGTPYKPTVFFYCQLGTILFDASSVKEYIRFIYRCK